MSPARHTITTFRGVIWPLAKHELEGRYLGSALGIAWAFLLPIIQVGIMWFALSQISSAGPKTGVPPLLWIVSGSFPWSFFAEAMTSAANSIVDKSYLVKKVVFQIELLPLIKIVASFVPFAVLHMIMLLIFLGYGVEVTWMWLQLPYYVVCIVALVLSVSWLTSALVVLYRDFGQVVSIVLQVGFWVTPVFWSPDRLPDHLKWIGLINPMHYVVMGFRDSLFSQKWIWESPVELAVFWIEVSFLAFFALLVFRKARPHFADVL